MSRFHILTPSWTSGATATSNSTATADTDADNLLRVQHSRKYRAATDSNVRVTLNAGTAKPFDTVYLGYHNGSATGQVTITAHASTGALFTTPSFSYGPVNMRFSGDLSSFLEYDSWINVGSMQTYQYIGIEIDDASNTAGYSQAGVVVVGQDFEPGIGADLGWQIGYVDPSEPRRALSGEAIVRPKRSYKTWEGTFPMQANSDAMRFYTINQVYGSKIPGVIKWDSYDVNYEQNFIIYGHLQWNRGPISYVNGEPYWEVQMSIEEV